MPLFLHRTISPATFVVIWAIEEPEDWFRSQLQLTEEETLIFDRLKKPLRRLHWLSSRYLIRYALGNPPHPIRLLTDEAGKPYLPDLPAHISIAHAQNMSALMISHEHAVGIDLEYLDPKILRVRSKFLNEKEWAQLNDRNDLRELYVYWCCKEAVYKLLGAGKLDFRKHLHVRPLDSRTDQVIVEECKTPQTRLRKLRIEYVKDYLLVYTL